MPAKATTPRPATTPKVVRQPKVWPMKVRNAGHDGDRQTHEHHGDSRCPAVFRHQIGSDRGADGEEDAVCESRDDTGNQEHFVAWAERGNDVADNKKRHQPEQERLTLDPPGQRCQDRRTEGDAQRVNADDEPGERQGDVEIVGDRRQQADDDEFRRADRVGGDRQRKESKWHESNPMV
jgi:hypothetical protein